MTAYYHKRGSRIEGVEQKDSWVPLIKVTRNPAPGMHTFYLGQRADGKFVSVHHERLFSHPKNESKFRFLKREDANDY